MFVENLSFLEILDWIPIPTMYFNVMTTKISKGMRPGVNIKLKYEVELTTSLSFVPSSSNKNA